MSSKAETSSNGGVATQPAPRRNKPRAVILEDSPAAEAAAAGNRRAAKLRSITIDPAKIKHYPAPVTKRYWVGAFPDAPFECRHAYAITFQKYTGVIEADPVTGKLNLERAQLGTVIDLTDEQVERACESISRKIVRTVGNKADATGNFRCDTHDVTAPGFRSMPGDVSFGKWLYMVEIHEKMDTDWRKELPDPMDPS